LTSFELRINDDVDFIATVEKIRGSWQKVGSEINPLGILM
jgi:hypothetical protein